MKQKPNTPVSQICALSVLPSTLIERVANSTPIVDFVSRLNSLRVNRESTCRKDSIEDLKKGHRKHTISIAQHSNCELGIKRESNEILTIFRHPSHQLEQPVSVRVNIGPAELKQPQTLKR